MESLLCTCPVFELWKTNLTCSVLMARLSRSLTWIVTGAWWAGAGVLVTQHIESWAQQLYLTDRTPGFCGFEWASHPGPPEVDDADIEICIFPRQGNGLGDSWPYPKHECDQVEFLLMSTVSRC